MSQSIQCAESVKTETYQRVSVESREGKALLRRVAKGNEDWTAIANINTDWKLEFTRHVKGGIGESDTRVTVRTDMEIRRAGKTGSAVKSFSDSQPVCVPAIRGVFFHSCDCYALATALLKGYRIECYSSAGSTSSSEYGLAFYHVYAYVPNSYISFGIGSNTVLKDGRQIVAGTCSV